MYYINGQFVQEEHAKISVLDLGLLRGFGVFDYLRTYRNRPFHLHEHLLRLQYSAEHIGLPLPKPLPEIADIVHTLLDETRYPESSLKLFITGGRSDDQFTPHQTPTLIAFVYPLKPYPSHYYTKGIHATTTPLSRSLPTSKTIQYIPAIVSLKKAPAQEALYLNQKNEILEGTTSNFFGFKNGTLITCDSEEVLFGITRDVVLKLAAPHFSIEYRAIPLSEKLDEAFITASNKEIMPVVTIDNHTIGSGQVGPHTQHLMRLFTDYTQSSNWPTLINPRYRT